MSAALPEPQSVTAIELFRQSARMEGKLDKIDDKLDGHSDTLARHEVRITSIEHTQQTMQDAAERASQSAEAERHQKANHSWGVVAAVVGGMTGGLFGLVMLILQILTHTH